MIDSLVGVGAYFGVCPDLGDADVDVGAVYL